MHLYCRSNISALNKWKKIHLCTHNLSHIQVGTHPSTQIHKKCSAITVNMHNLINIFAQLQ